MNIRQTDHGRVIRHSDLVIRGVFILLVVGAWLRIEITGEPALGRNSLRSSGSDFNAQGVSFAKKLFQVRGFKAESHRNNQRGVRGAGLIRLVQSEEFSGPIISQPVQPGR